MFRETYDWTNVINPITDEQVKDWIVALRSGNYVQAEEELRTTKVIYKGAYYADMDDLAYCQEDEEDYKPDEAVEQTCHCCLGVLGERIESIPEFINLDSDSMLISEELNPDDWDTRKRDIVALPENLQNKLAGMNDGGQTFAEIADYLEAGFITGDAEILKKYDQS